MSQENQNLNKNDFVDWKNNSVTKVFFDSIKSRITELEHGLARTAGENPIQDARVVGMIQFAEAILNIDFEEMTNE